MRSGSSSRDRTSGGSSFLRSSADNQNGPRAESSSSNSSASGSLGGAFGSAGLEPGLVQFGFDPLALGVVQLPVVDADLREIAAEPGTAPGARSAQMSGP